MRPLVASILSLVVGQIILWNAPGHPVGFALHLPLTVIAVEAARHRSRG